jgi:hypothetical protein
VGTTPVAADLHAGFTNCIFWGDNGNVDNEVVVAQQGNSVFSLNFSNCLWKVKSNPPGVVMTNMIANTNPLFDSVNNNSPGGFYDFHLQAGSPALNKGTATGILIDLDGHPRPIGLPDLGCYERQ